MNAFERRPARTERVVVLLTAEEKDFVQARAERENLSMSEFLRLAVLAACDRGTPDRPPTSD